jgi:hypothetical protein
MLGVIFCRRELFLCRTDLHSKTVITTRNNVQDIKVSHGESLNRKKMLGINPTDVGLNTSVGLPTLLHDLSAATLGNCHKSTLDSTMARKSSNVGARANRHFVTGSASCASAEIQSK